MPTDAGSPGPSRTTISDGRRPTLRLPAYAKINLSLEILGKRPDGFHELVSVSQVISLADQITVQAAQHLEITTTPPILDDDENLVRRAAEALALATGHPAHGRVTLRKRIPLAAGLGGGSSDAATTLRLLDRLWGTRLPARRLSEIAATLGSDVALFLDGGTVLMRGRGEQVEPLPPVRPFWLVLVCPGGAPNDKTRALYRTLTPDDWSDGSATLGLAGRLRGGDSIDGQALVNSFDGAADRVYSGFPTLRQQLRELTGSHFHLTGAGPSLFALHASAPDARAAAHAIQRIGLPAYVAHSVSRRPLIRASHPGPGRFSQ